MLPLTFSFSHSYLAFRLRSRPSDHSGCSLHSQVTCTHRGHMKWLFYACKDTRRQCLPIHLVIYMWLRVVYVSVQRHWRLRKDLHQCSIPKTISPSFSQSANSHSAFIINHRITPRRFPNDVGWWGTSHDRICNCLHNAQLVRYQTLVRSTNTAWGLCSCNCHDGGGVRGSGKDRRHVPHNQEQRKWIWLGCCVNKSDWMWVLWVWDFICWKHDLWFFSSSFIHRSASLNT